jgi:MFS family permease
MRGWLRQTVGGLPGTFWYLWVGTLINRAGSFVVVFLALYLTSARHFSPSYAGLVVGLYGLGGATGTLLGGVLADRWGRRPTLLLSYLSGASCMLALGLLRDRWAIAAGALVLGTGAEMARPAFAALMVDVVPARDRLRAFTLNYWAINLGFACSSILAGLAAQVSYLLLFAGDAATTVVTALIVLTRVRDVPHVPIGPAERSRAGLRTVFADRVFLGLVALNLLTALVFMQHMSGLPIAMARDGLSPATFGAVIALNGVLIVLGQLFVPRLIGGRDRSRVLAVAALVFGTGFGLTAFAHTALAYAGTVLVWTLGEMLNSPSNSTLLAELSPARMRGRYQGVFSLSWQGAAALAPVVGGLVQQHAGSRWLWLGCGAVGALVAAGQVVSGPARERRTARLRAAEATTEAPARRARVAV